MLSIHPLVQLVATLLAFYVLLIGFLSGLYMHKQKQKRIVLPLFHGTVNALLLFPVLLQVFSGWKVYGAFVLGN